MRDINDCIRFDEGRRFGDWNIIDLLEEGGFGRIYVVVNYKTKVKAALKAEPNNIEGGSAIKLELKVLLEINADGEKPHIPFVFHGAKHREFCYMVMTLLGETLKELKAAQRGQLFSTGTWPRLGIQCLYAIKTLHDYGFIHRDIKPNNFVMGHPADPERSRMVFLLDFGLARSYAFKLAGKWILRVARGKAAFRGTMRYCSINVHDGLEQGRRDDIWSLYYIWIEHRAGLPWQLKKKKKKIEFTKCRIDDCVLNWNMPPEIKFVPFHLREIQVYERPDYLRIYNALMDILKRKNIGLDDPYDWEKGDSFEILKPSKKPAWQDAEEFFRSDPINVEKPPEKPVTREEIGPDGKLILPSLIRKRKKVQTKTFELSKTKDDRE